MHQISNDIRYLFCSLFDRLITEVVSTRVEQSKVSRSHRWMESRVKKPKIGSSRGYKFNETGHRLGRKAYVIMRRCIECDRHGAPVCTKDYIMQHKEEVLRFWGKIVEIESLAEETVVQSVVTRKFNALPSMRRG
jgi:hypothetical protein